VRVWPLCPHHARSAVADCTVQPTPESLPAGWMEDTTWNPFDNDDNELWWRLRTLWRKDVASMGDDWWRSEKTWGIYSHGGQLREGRRSGERGEATDVTPIRVTSARWDGSHRMRAEGSRGLSPCYRWVFGVRKRWGYIHGAQLAADLNWFALNAERRLIDFFKGGEKITNQSVKICSWLPEMRFPVREMDRVMLSLLVY
jgi:hypothetical protein